MPFSSASPSFGPSVSGARPAAASAVAAGTAALATTLAHADHRRGHVGQRREVARRADRALRRDHRRQPLASIASSSATVSGRTPEAPCARLASFSAIISRTTAPASARRPRPHGDSTMLRWSVRQLAVADADAGQLPEAGVDPVDGLRRDPGCGSPRRAGRDQRRGRRVEPRRGAAIDGAPVGEAAPRRAEGRWRSETSPDTGIERVEAHAVDEFGRRSTSQIARSQHLPASSVPVSSPCPSARAASRVSPSRHSRRSAEQGSRPCSSPAAARSAATCRDCSRSPARSGRPPSRSLAERRHARLAHEVEGAGQQDATVPAAAIAATPAASQVFEMIGRQRAVRCRQRRAVEVGQLFRVQFDGQADARAPPRTPARSGRARSRCPRRRRPPRRPAPLRAIAGIISSHTVDITVRIARHTPGATRARRGRSSDAHRPPLAQIAAPPAASSARRRVAGRSPT